MEKRGIVALHPLIDYKPAVAGSRCWPANPVLTRLMSDGLVFFQKNLQQTKHLANDRTDTTKSACKHLGRALKIVCVCVCVCVVLFCFLVGCWYCYIL